MIDLRTAPKIAIVCNGLGVAALLLGHPVITLVLLACSLSLITWSLDRLRAQLDGGRRR